MNVRRANKAMSFTNQIPILVIRQSLHAINNLSRKAQ